jgi:hypothetical protein
VFLVTLSCLFVTLRKNNVLVCVNCPTEKKFLCEIDKVFGSKMQKAYFQMTLKMSIF